MKKSLLQYNTFGVDSYTSKLSVINQRSDIDALIHDKAFDPENFLFIGAGSNLLLLDEVPEHVIAMRLSGIEYQQQSNGDVKVTAAAGVNWHDLVQDTLSNGYSGLENLALIPGLVGAAPIQNIGAYGVEQCDKFISLTAINMKTGEEKIFYKSDCQFGYRDSVFKQTEDKCFLITSVSYLLDSKDKVCIDYKALNDAFIEHTNITALMVFEKVCKIRASKLPDPKKLGNAGSFFKNPIVSNDQYIQLKAKFPDLIAYSQPGNEWKLAAGWMIQKSGLKGYRKDNVGVHVDQALVLVNYHSSSEQVTVGSDIVELARYVQDTVTKLFSVTLEPEVTIVGSSGVTGLWDSNK